MRLQIIFFCILALNATIAPGIWSAESFEPEMVLIPAGPFIAGSSDFERSQYRVPHHEPAAHVVELATFWIGKYEISDDQYEIFMNDGGYSYPSYWSKEGWAAKLEYNWKEPRRWRDLDYRGKRTEVMPVCAVSWYEAQAYCRWLTQKTGKPYRLPASMEWEKAARGVDGHIFPWGNEWDTNRCNWYGYLGEVKKDQMDTDSYLYVSPIGSFENGKSPWGCYDMAGNVLEWCSDAWPGEESLYRVFRGGSFYTNNPRLFRCAWRGGTYPDTGHVYWGIFGFRVAMDAVLEGKD